MSNLHITEDALRALRSEAAEAGDLGQVEICDLALAGSVDAYRECERVIRYDARGPWEVQALIAIAAHKKA
jgi:hypothetical protein